MRVARDEQVVTAGWHRAAQDTPLRGVQILSLVDDDVIVRGCRPGQEVGRTCTHLQMRGGLPGMQHRLEQLDGRPQLIASRRWQRAAAPAPQGAAVGVGCAQVLGEYDVSVLLSQELLRPRQPHLLDDTLPQLPFLPVVDGGGGLAVEADHDAVRVGVDRGHVDTAEQRVVTVEEQGQVLAQ